MEVQACKRVFFLSLGYYWPSKCFFQAADSNGKWPQSFDIQHGGSLGTHHLFCDPAICKKGMQPNQVHACAFLVYLSWKLCAGEQTYKIGDQKYQHIQPFLAGISSDSLAKCGGFPCLLPATPGVTKPAGVAGSRSREWAPRATCWQLKGTVWCVGTVLCWSKWKPAVVLAPNLLESHSDSGMTLSWWWETAARATSPTREQTPTDRKSRPDTSSWDLTVCLYPFSSKSLHKRQLQQNGFSN